MAYATPDQLAQALRTALTPKLQPGYEQALAAAAQEIDHALDRVDPLPDPAPELVVSVNIARAVEWVKAADAIFGGVGYADVGLLKVAPDGFARHAANLIPLTQQFGLA